MKHETAKMAAIQGKRGTHMPGKNQRKRAKTGWGQPSKTLTSLAKSRLSLPPQKKGMATRKYVI